MPLKIDVLTLFPRMLDSVLAESILGKGIAAGHLGVSVHDLRAWTTDKHRTADDRPFGGGAGMVMKPEPAIAAIEAVQTPGCRRIYLTPDGTPLSPALAEELSRQQHLVLLSGHYEGIDQRIRDTVIDQEISIGDYVLSGGELGAMVIIDAVFRLLPGVLGDDQSNQQDSFSAESNGQRLLDCPHYTRPREWRGRQVPDVLMSGDHGKVAAWRLEQKIARTKSRRPDLLG